MRVDDRTYVVLYDAIHARETDPVRPRVPPRGRLLARPIVRRIPLLTTRSLHGEEKTSTSVGVPGKLAVK